MLHTSSNRGTPVSNDITKIVRQHYKPPSAKPYKHELVQCRNEMSCKKDKPDDYWTTNYRRRQNNFDSGFYSTPWEPYKAIGGDLILDPFDLVASSLPGNIDRKMNPKFARRGTVYSLTERLMSASAAKKEEKDKEDTSLLSEDQIDTCPTAGFENIKKFLKESSDRMVAVRSGMSYEEHVRLAEERMREEEEGKLDTDDDMVVQSTSDSLLVPSINSPKFDTTIAEEDEDEDGDRMGTPRSILTGSSKTSASSGRRMSRSPTEKWRNLSPMAIARRMSVRTPPKKLSLGKVSSGIGTGLIRRERLCRDQLEFLTSIYNILTAIHNMKGRDLRVKVPLSKEIVEKLQKESHKESQNEGGERQSSRGTQMNWGATRRSRKMSAIDFDLGSERQASPANSLVKHTSMSNKSRWSRKMMSTDTVDCPEDRGGPPPGFGGAVKRISVLDNVGKAFGRRRSRVASESQPTRPMLETWEDLINVQPQEYREEALPTSFGMQAGILSKFMRWYRRASVIPTHVAGQPLPAIDKDQLRHLEEVREKGLGDKDLPPLPQQPMPMAGPGGPPGSALGNQEKARKLPIWQQVAQEKSTVFQNKKSTTANSPYTLLHRINEDTNRMKRSLQKENTAALEKLAREKVANFRLKFSALSQEECSPLYSEQLYKLQQVKENVHRSHLENFDVQPSKWYEELREKTQAQPYCDDSAICDMIIKLQTYCHMDNKTVPYAKAKLCLLTMSLPAYNICQIQTQKALKAKMDLSIYDKETIERARHRGRAYLCLACVHLKKKRVADELGKLEDHIVRNHVELERVPFYCQLCTFKCMKQGQFTSHLSQNKRHMFMCSQRQIQDSSHWKVVSPNPYVITEVDMQKLSQEESLRFFLERQTRQLSPLDEGLSKLIAGTLDADLTEDTLRTCAIPMTSAGNSQIPVPASTATTQPDRIPPTFQGMQQPAIQGVPPQQWPAISSLAMFQHPLTAPTWNPMMMSIMPQTATQPTTQPTQLAGQTWNPAMLPSAPQPATQPMTQPSPFTGPMWTPTTMSMVQQPATQPMMQQPATSPMMQQPATQPMMQQPATQTTMQQPAPSPMVQQPATQPTTQQPAVRIWNPAMMDTTVTSRSSFKPVTPAVDMEQGGAVGNQTVPVLTMGLDSSPRGSVSRASIGPLPTTPAPEREATPVNASTGTASPDDTSNAPGAFTEPTSQSSTLNEASQEPPTNVEETEAAELADPSEVVEDITGQLLEGEEMTLSSPVVPDERRRVEEKESGSKDAEAGQSTEGRSGATKGMKRRAMTEQEIRKRKVEKEMPDCKGDHQGENSEELVSVEEMLGKRRRTEGEPEEPTVRISLVAMNSLVSTLQSLKGQMARNEKASEKVEKGLKDIAVELSKVRDALYRWKDVAEGLANEEKRREERRIEADRRKEEDDRREREAERRRADRRREEERKDRQDLRQLLVELREERDKEKKRNEVRKDDKDGSRNEGRKEDRDMSGSRTRREDKEDRRDKSRKDRKDEDCEDKENTRVMRSALSRQYTENKVEDLTNKIL